MRPDAEDVLLTGSPATAAIPNGSAAKFPVPSLMIGVGGGVMAAVLATDED